MNWKIQIPNRVRKELLKLPIKLVTRVAKAIDRLAENPYPKGAKKLKNSEAWRIRVGDYRVIYEIHEQFLLIRIIRVRHRKGVYRNR